MVQPPVVQPLMVQLDNFLRRAWWSSSEPYPRPKESTPEATRKRIQDALCLDLGNGSMSRDDVWKSLNSFHS